MNKIALTDWDCYLLQRALLLKYHLYVQKTADTHTEAVKMQEERRDLKDLYQATHALHRSLTLDENTRQNLIKDVHVLERHDEKNDWVAGTVYNPHLYKVLLTKLDA